jgi:hypothetical protein
MLALAGLLSGCEPANEAGSPPPATAAAAIPVGTGFDFYVL